MNKRVCGVDIGGTTVKLALFDGETLLDKWEIPTRTENRGSAILQDVAQSVRDHCSPDAVGVGVPGPVSESGIVSSTANLGWDSPVDLSGTLGETLGVPVVTANDANVAALGEMWHGAGRGHDSIVMLTLGTGLGGGVVIRGEILAGANGAGGEIGHIHIDDDEKDFCGCGNQGCLEQYVSATGMVRLARKHAVYRDRSDLTAREVWDAVKAGEGAAIETASVWGRILAKGMAIIAAVVDPELFVIGGGMSKAGPVILDYLTAAYRQYAYRATKDTGIVLATLGNDAGVYGCAKLALDRL